MFNGVDTALLATPAMKPNASSDNIFLDAVADGDLDADGDLGEGRRDRRRV